MIDTETKVGDDHFDQAIVEHLSAGKAYADAVEQAAGSLLDRHVAAAAHRLAESIDALIAAHRKYTGGGMPWIAVNSTESIDDAGDHFEFPPEDDPIWTRDPERMPRLQEIPVYLAMGQVIAEGDWGVVRIRQAIIYTSGITLEFEHIRLRLPSESDDQWDALDMDSERQTRLAFDGGARLARLAGGNGGGSRVGARQSVRSFWLEGNLADLDPACEITMVVESIPTSVNFRLDLELLQAASAAVRVL